jgi:hypothetical protein
MPDGSGCDKSLDERAAAEAVRDDEVVAGAGIEAGKAGRA